MPAAPGHISNTSTWRNETEKVWTLPISDVRTCSTRGVVPTDGGRVRAGLFNKGNGRGSRVSVGWGGGGGVGRGWGGGVGLEV